MIFSRKNNATIAEIIALSNQGVIGAIETRNLLAEEYPAFKKARRQEVDTTLEQLGVELQNSQVELGPIEENEEEGEFDFFGS